MCIRDRLHTDQVFYLCRTLFTILLSLEAFSISHFAKWCIMKLKVTMNRYSPQQSTTNRWDSMIFWSKRTIWCAVYICILLHKIINVLNLTHACIVKRRAIPCLVKSYMNVSHLLSKKTYRHPDILVANIHFETVVRFRLPWKDTFDN